MEMFIVTHKAELPEQAIMMAYSKEDAITCARVFRPNWKKDDLIVEQLPQGTVCFRKMPLG